MIILRKEILLIFLLSLLAGNISIMSFAEEFNANDLESFETALNRANQAPMESHRINIDGDITLDSPITEAVSLELTGSNSLNPYTFSLNGNVFTYNGAGKVSEISDLKILSNVSGSGLVLNDQTMNISNTTFDGQSIRNIRSAIINNGGDLFITDSVFTGNINPVNSYYAGAIRNTGNGILNVHNSQFTKNTGYEGGGIYLSNGEAEIYNTEFSGNNALNYGGAIYVNSGTLNIKDSTIKENSASNLGGGIYINTSANAVVDNTKFENNTVEVQSLGGAIYNNGNLTIKNGSSFVGNHVTGGGGAILNKGAINIDNAVFDSNTSVNEGGAIDNSGTLTVSNSTFTNNKSSASFGGAIVLGEDVKITNCLFDKNSSYDFGGAIVANDAVITYSVFKNNVTENSSGGAVVNLYGNVDLNNSNYFENNIAGQNGGALYGTTGSVTNISGKTSFINNTAKTGYGGAILAQGTFNINANDASAPIVFSGNKDSTGSNAFHLDIAAGSKPEEVGTMNLNISNGGQIVLADNISGLEGTKLNIKGTSSYNDKVYLGAANENFKGDVTANNIQLNFYNNVSGLANAAIIKAMDTNLNFMNGSIGEQTLNMDLSGGGNSLSIDVDPAAGVSDYINLVCDPANMTQLTIRDINVLSEPVQSVTIFDLYNHDLYGTDLVLSPDLQNATVYGALKEYRWGLTPKLTLFETGGLNPNIQRYQGATAAAFMNQMLSYDYSLNRTDEIYTNLREHKLAARRANSYASIGPTGMYVDQYYEDGSAFWMRPYVNLESFHLSGALGTVNNQSYGVMMGLDLPMIRSRNDWLLFPTIYGSYIGSSQQFIDSNIHQNGGYGGFLLSAYKDDFYAGWTINGGGLGVESRYSSAKDDYAIVTAGTALKLAYNWKILKRLILQPNFTTAYTFLSPSSLVNEQGVDLNQTQVNGLTIAPSLRLTYRNEEGFEPYIYGGCVIPIMSDVKASADGVGLEKMTLNAWAQFGAGVRKRITERITCFAETIIRTGGRDGWGFMFNIQIAI